MKVVEKLSDARLGEYHREKIAVESIGSAIDGIGSAIAGIGSPGE
jgi:hypothetical protein